MSEPRIVEVLGVDDARAGSAMALYLPHETVKVGSFPDRFVRTAEGWRFAGRRGDLAF